MFTERRRGSGGKMYQKLLWMTWWSVSWRFLKHTHHYSLWHPHLQPCNAHINWNYNPPFRLPYYKSLALLTSLSSRFYMTMSLSLLFLTHFHDPKPETNQTHPVRVSPSTMPCSISSSSISSCAAKIPSNQWLLGRTWHSRCMFGE